MPPIAPAARKDERHHAAELYEHDAYRWAMRQADALRRRDFASVDWENVIEEIEDVGKRYRDRWISNCAQAIHHLLEIERWELATNSDLRHWSHEIGNYRAAMADTIRDNPGLKGRYESMFRRAWMRGRDAAVRALVHYEVGRGSALSERQLRFRWDQMLPRECPYSLDEVAAFDPKRDRDPRADWPAGAARVLTNGLGVEHAAAERLSPGRGRSH